MSRLASRSLDGDLGRLEQFALRLHVLYCAACRRYRNQLERIRRLVHQWAGGLDADGPLPGPRLPDDVRARIKRTLKGA
jgi:hypothetical protein